MVSTPKEEEVVMHQKKTKKVMARKVAIKKRLGKKKVAKNKRIPQEAAHRSLSGILVFCSLQSLASKLRKAFILLTFHGLWRTRANLL